MHFMVSYFEALPEEQEVPMAAKHTHNPSPPGRSRVFISGTKDDGAILHFYPWPSKRVYLDRLLKAFKVMDYPDAEQALKDILPTAFRREARNRGFTLVECMKEAKALLRASNGSPEWLMTDDQLADLLTTLAPGMEPYLAMVHLRMLLKSRGKFAIRILRGHETRPGDELD